MIMKKKNKLEIAYKKYVDCLQDLSDNPVNEAKSNEEIEPLFKANEKTMEKALLENENETRLLFENGIAFDYLYNFFPAVQKHFKSKAIAETINKTLKLIEEGKFSFKCSSENLEEYKQKVVEANKYLNNNI